MKSGLPKAFTGAIKLLDARQSVYTGRQAAKYDLDVHASSAMFGYLHFFNWLRGMNRHGLFSFVFLLFIAGAPPALAQEWTGNLKVGASITTFTGDTPTTFDPRVGWAGGFALGYDFGNGFVVQPEVLYVTRGASFDSALEGVPIRVHSRVSYAKIPVLVMYRLQRGTIHPKIFAGPLLASRLDAVINYRTEGSSQTQQEADNSLDDYDYGGLIGAGADVDWSGQRLSLEVRATFGLANLRTSEPALYHRGVLVLIGFVF